MNPLEFYTKSPHIRALEAKAAKEYEELSEVDKIKKDMILNTSRQWKDLAETNKALFLGIGDRSPQVVVTYRKCRGFISAKYDGPDPPPTPKQIKTTKIYHHDGFVETKREYVW